MAGAWTWDLWDCQIVVEEMALLRLNCDTQDCSTVTVIAIIVSYSYYGVQLSRLTALVAYLL